MPNPVLVELTRGPLVESHHRGAIAVARADGSMTVALGDIDRPIYPRSAFKALQAVALVESGAAEAMGLDDRALALACASHSGSDAHVETARATLAKAGLDEAALACGAHWPRDEAAAHGLVRTGRKPGPLYNNCSGKHAGMLALAVHLGASPAGYESPDHPVQEHIRETISAITGAELRHDRCAVDGCSVPNWALPLRALAHGFARFATGDGLPPPRAEACARLRQACFAAPYMVAGEGRLCTKVMTRCPGRAFVKVGAEGVYCAAFPEHGLGVAIKIDDGGRRAAELVVSTIVGALLEFEPIQVARLAARNLRNWRGLVVGERLPAEALRDALKSLAVHHV
ncbi:MAG: asparaginase [Methyloligellaceae bacterium]